MSAFDSHAPLLPEILSLHGKWKGNKPALICGDEIISWRTFDEDTNRIANGLVAKGISRGAMVGVVMSNGRAMVEALIGIMKAGACSVPINLSVTDEAMASMLADAGVEAICTTADQSARLHPYISDHPGVLHVDGEDGLNALKVGAVATLPSVKIMPDDALNVIYSSGTTGMPKDTVMGLGTSCSVSACRDGG